ncbi:MAG: hypothetical protein AABW88_02065 [Nanoarchaeota archaeon]
MEDIEKIVKEAYVNFLESTNTYNELVKKEGISAEILINRRLAILHKSAHIMRTKAQSIWMLREAMKNGYIPGTLKTSYNKETRMYEDLGHSLLWDFSILRVLPLVANEALTGEKTTVYLADSFDIDFRNEDPKYWEKILDMEEDHAKRELGRAVFEMTKYSI